MKIKTSNLIGVQLDWAVAKVSKVKVGVCLGGYLAESKSIESTPYSAKKYSPSTDWAQGGPILTHERISRTIEHSGLWIAYWTDGYADGDEGKEWMHCDRSELVAGLRCYVASKLGDEVEIPEELM